LKLCPGTGEEVVWNYINQTTCSVCKNFVNYKTIEEVDANIDVACRHYPDGQRVAVGPRVGKHG
jgi:hypothetical protein|tara:strand:- start:745 stop:936 length:192 start_codon:yes stop_codon:yes gene_type:complete